MVFCYKRSIYFSKILRRTFVVLVVYQLRLEWNQVLEKRKKSRMKLVVAVEHAFHFIVRKIVKQKKNNLLKKKKKRKKLQITK
jgi:hypothetical protein